MDELGKKKVRTRSTSSNLLVLTLRYLLFEEDNQDALRFLSQEDDDSVHEFLLGKRQVNFNYMMVDGLVNFL